MIRIAALALAIAMMMALVPARALAVTDIGTVYTESALLGDLDSGAVLYDKNADEQIIPASTTKVLTAMLIIEAIERGELDPEDRVWATQEIIDGVVYDASRVLPYIQDGEDLTVREYLCCILLASDCVACDILANRVCGSVADFVALMNERAAELGCKDTNFVNTHGYPEEGHYTTSRSLFLIMREAMKYDLFREIISTIKMEIPATPQSKEVRKLYNSNWMIWDPDKITSMYTKNYYPYSIGGKTGSSKKSGHCLVSCAQKDGVTLVAVVTGGANEIAEESGEWTNRSFSESRKLFEWGFENYAHVTLMASGSDAGTAAVSNGQTDSVGLVTAGEVAALLPKDADAGDAEIKKVYVPSTIVAPVSAGDVVGRIEVYYDGTLRGGAELKASGSVERSVKKITGTEDPGKEEGRSNKTLIVMILFTLVAFVGALVLYITNNKKILLNEYYAGSKGAVQISRKTAEFFSSGLGNGATQSGGAQNGAKRPRPAGTGAQASGSAQRRTASYDSRLARNGQGRAPAQGRSPQGQYRQTAGRRQGQDTRRGGGNGTR